MSSRLRILPRPLLVAVAVCAMGGGCRATPTPPPENPLETGVLPTWEVGTEDPIPASVVEGVLEVDEERQCVALDGDGALWPRGFRLERDPYRIVDADGQVVAHDGERIRAGGGYVPTARLPDPCGTDYIAIVGDMKVAPAPSE